jgi:aspartyl-tRNA(Asn)/glutamyl-tRNA(Gln) amidotransferase subunit B
VTQYEAVIGLEVHAQLLTTTKLFCGCSVQVGAEPNSQVCPVCLGLPGSLPVTNGRAIELGVRAAIALGCTIHTESVFARKHYFYPDLPKGYQISQFERPFATEGGLDIVVDGRAKRATIVRIHFEEDAGKSVHGVGGQSLVDLNRTGTALIEIVGAPDLHTSAEAAAYLRALRDVLMFAGVNDGNLEEGSFRCDANVSIRPRGETRLGTRTELKNINSFRFVQRAIDAEILRQSILLDRGQSVIQETRAFDPDTGLTRTLRSKANAHDYRYFPEPDLPPLFISDALRAEQQEQLIGSPDALRARYTSELGLSANAAATLTQHPAYVRLFSEVVQQGVDAVRAANWITTEVLRDTVTDGLVARFPVQASQIVELLKLVDTGVLALPQAKRVHTALVGTTRSAREVVEELGLSVISSDQELEPLCHEVLAANARNVEQYRSGKTGLLGFFVGQVMKKTGGRADAQRVSALLQRLLAPQGTAAAGSAE